MKLRTVICAAAACALVATVGTAAWAVPAQPMQGLTLSGAAHIQNIGDTTYAAASQGETLTLGTTGQSLRVESITLNLEGYDASAISYSAHVQNVGWIDAVGNGEACGTSGQALRMEAVTISLGEELSANYSIYYRAHVQNIGWMAWACDGAPVGSQGKALRIEALQVVILPAGSAAPTSDDQASDKAFTRDTGDGLLNYTAHVQNDGWQGYVSDGETAGTEGRSLRVEALKANTLVEGLGVEYRTYVQNLEWTDWAADGALAGTEGQSLRVEAIEARLTGEQAENYHIYYRAHVQNIGWLDWACDGDAAGSADGARRMEAFQMVIVADGEDAPGGTDMPFVSPDLVTLACQTYSVNSTEWASVATGETAGTTGESRALLGIALSVEDAPAQGSISYTAHLSNIGWTDAATDGAQLGTLSDANPVECLTISLAGRLSEVYDIYYRTHINNYGWSGWACNGAKCGSTGLGRTLEAYEVKLVPKGGPAPGSTLHTYSDERGFLAADRLRALLGIVEDYRASFDHGSKPASCQKYIVLHDTEGTGSAASVINYWDGNGSGVAAHFIVNMDGTVWQCVGMDRIAHHAGYGNAGHNAYFGVTDESRDDKRGTVSIGSYCPDYGMNSYSIGIEMVHASGSSYYPEAQLNALDTLIAYIDAYYGFESTIIDHKDWRNGNSDTSAGFAGYLANYKDHRTHY